MEVIDLISSSSMDTIDDRKQDNEPQRITTPTFNAFREKWLTLSEKSRTPSYTPPRNSPLAPKTKRSRVKLSDVIDLDAEYNHVSAEMLSAFPSDIILTKVKEPKTRSAAVSEVELHVTKRFTDYFTDFAEAAASQGVAVVPADTEDQFYKFAWKRKNSITNTDHCLIMYELRDGSLSVDEISINSFVTNIVRQLKEAAHSTKTEVLIYGGKQLFTKMSADVNRRFRQALSAGERLVMQTPVLSWCEFENKMWMECFKHGMRVRFVEKNEELYAFLIEYTKSISWEPFSRRTDYISCCLKPNKKVAPDLQGTWKDFLEAISRCTHEICEAIIGRYPTMHSLLVEYDRLDQAHGELLLSEISVGRRQLGPALSRRIYRVLNCMNPNKTAYLS